MRTSSAEAFRLEDGGLNQNADNQMACQTESRLSLFDHDFSPPWRDTD